MTDVATIGDVKARRHRWGEPRYFQYKTERTCEACGITKVTRHEPGEQPWLEFWRGLDKVAVDKTPACEPVQ